MRAGRWVAARASKPSVDHPAAVALVIEPSVPAEPAPDMARSAPSGARAQRAEPQADARLPELVERPEREQHVERREQEYVPAREAGRGERREEADDGEAEPHGRHEERPEV